MHDYVFISKYNINRIQDITSLDCALKPCDLTGEHLEIILFARRVLARSPHPAVRIEARLYASESRYRYPLTADGVDFYTINSKGYVPIRELEDGQRLSEGPVIAQFIADRAHRTDLMPAAGSMARYRVVEWQNYITAELHKCFGPLFNPAVDATGKTVFSAILSKKFRWVSDQLRGKAYLAGENFTAADAYLFTVASWAQYVNLDLSDLEHLQALLKRVASRPAVQEAMRAEDLLSA